jgi:hypothetical protein
MYLTARLTTWVCAAFALVCSGFAGKGLLALPAIQDEAERELARGYTGFWLFLLAVAVVFGVVSHLMAKGRFGGLRD